MDSTLTDEQIERFLNAQCSAEEYAHIVEIAQQDPAYQYLLKKWAHTDLESDLPDAVSKRMLKNIRRETHYEKPRRIWMAAASILFILLGAMAYKMLRPADTASLAAVTESKKEAVSGWNTIRNDSTEMATWLLPDSSVLKLYKGASVEYEAGFGSSAKTRSIRMKGKAFFDVAKDANHPFIVYTGTVSTTALGTSFTIEEDSGEIRIALHSGKVQLKKETKTLPGWTNDIILIPGQKMSYNKLNGYCKINTSRHTESNAYSLKKTTKAEAFTLLFNNAALPEVLDSLIEKYKVAIQYDKNEISERYFSGTIKSKDRLPDILKLIGQLNDLTITTEGNNYKILVTQQ